MQMVFYLSSNLQMNKILINLKIGYQKHVIIILKNLVVGNKTDLTEKRVVNKEKMENFAKKWN